MFLLWLETIKGPSRGRFVVSLVHRKQSVSDSMMFIPHVSRRSQRPTVQHVYYHHRAGRVLSFFSSRQSWDSSNPSPAGGEFALLPPPRPPVLGRVGTLAGERGVGRDPIPTRGHVLLNSLFIRTL